MLLVISKPDDISVRHVRFLGIISTSIHCPVANSCRAGFNGSSLVVIGNQYSATGEGVLVTLVKAITAIIGSILTLVMVKVNTSAEREQR